MPRRRCTPGMLEITAFELRRRIRGLLYLSVSLLAYSGLVIGIFPSIKEAGADIQSFIEALPPEIRTGFVGEASTYTTIEGFLSAEMYQFVILLIMGMYFAYAAASAIATEIDDGSVDVLLVHPVSRTRLVIGKYLSLVPVIVTVNAVMVVGTWAAVGFIGEEIDLVNLALLHGMAVPYLLACAALGMLASVYFDTPRRAQSVGAGGVFGMFLIHTVTLERDFEWLGDFTFARYYDAQEILVQSEYDWGGLAVLVAAAVILVILSAEYFERKDIA